MGKSFNLKGYTKKTQDKKQDNIPSKFQGLRDSEKTEDTKKTQDNVVRETVATEIIKTQKSNNKNTKQTQDSTNIKKPEKKSVVSAPKKTDTQVRNKISTGQTQENIRINMAFTDGNYNIIAQESAELGIPMAAFINETVSGANVKEVDAYIAGLAIIPNKNMIPRRKGHKMKRINVRLTPEVHNILTSGADKYNQTLTQYLTCLLNCTIQK